MSKALSLYLDFLRFSAAFLVFLYHSRNIYAFDSLVFKLGHEAVIVFFVMSGYVIAFCHATKERTLREFSVNRASRIYSVAIPALFLTLALDLIGKTIDPGAYGNHFDLPIVRFLSSLLFTNELWWVSIQSFSNVPYWSINYEVWYYVSFAVVFYTSRPFIGFAVVCLLIGPKIFLLLPLWWLGVWLYRRDPLQSASKTLALGLFTTSSIGMFAFASYGLSYVGWDMLEELVGPDSFRDFAFSRYFLSDYLLGAMVALNFASASTLLRDVSINENSAAVRLIRWFAGLTFVLYLIHQPLLNFFDTYFATIIAAPKAHYLATSMATLMVVIAVGHPIEATKRMYRSAINAMINSFTQSFVAKPRPTPKG